MVFQRARTIRGRTYIYWVEAYRDEHGRPRQRHLGKSLLRTLLDAVPQPIPEEERGLAYIERLIEKYPGDPFEAKKREPAEEAAPAPVEKPSTSAQSPSPEIAPGDTPSAPGETDD